MTRLVSINFAVESARGQTVATFDNEDRARAYVSERRLTVPGLTVVEVVTTIERRAVYRPRLRIVASA